MSDDELPAWARASIARAEGREQRILAGVRAAARLPPEQAPTLSPETARDIAHGLQASAQQLEEIGDFGLARIFQRHSERYLAHAVEWPEES